jgi:hypothetical protein
MSDGADNLCFGSKSRHLGVRATRGPCAQKPNSSNNSMPVCASGRNPRFRLTKIINYAIPNRLDSARGADRDRHEREAGCDGRGLYRRTCDTIADGGGVWSWHPWAGAKPVDDESVGDGDYEVTDTGESSHNAVNTIAQGKPDCFGVPVVTNSCAFFVAHEAAGAQNTRFSLRPLHFEGRDARKTWARSRREPRAWESAV